MMKAVGSTFMTTCVAYLFFSLALAYLFLENRELRREFRSFTCPSSTSRLLALDKDSATDLQDRVGALEVAFATVPSRLEKLESSDGLSKKQKREVKKQVRNQVKKQLKKVSSFSPTDFPSPSLSRKRSANPSKIPSDIASEPPSGIPSKLTSDGPTEQDVGCAGNFSDWTALNAGVRLFFSNRTSAIALYGDIGSWCTSSVESFLRLFKSPYNGSAETLFNEDLNGWDLSSVTSLYSTFFNAKSFNGDVSEWDVASVSMMHNTFTNADSFNRDISGWDVSSVTHLEYTIGAEAFNNDISGWDVSSTLSLKRTFKGATNFNKDISGWDVSSNTNLQETFKDAQAFNIDISSWDITSSVSFYMMFTDAVSFEQCLDWSADGRETRYMFTGSSGRLAPCSLACKNKAALDNDGLAEALELFSSNRKKAEKQYGKIHMWCTSEVTDISGFEGHPCYENGESGDDEGYGGGGDDYGCDDGYRWTDGFYGNENFNEDLTNWDVSSVTKFYAAFIDQDKFNQDISKWDVSSSTSFRSTFYEASKFNQNLSGWDISLSTTFEVMFAGASAFNQCLDWSNSILQGADTSDMFLNSAGGKLC